MMVDKEVKRKLPYCYAKDCYTKRRFFIMLQTEKVKQGKRVLLIPPSNILKNPNQPRRYFDRDELYGLADSIEENGMIQPLTVRKLIDGRYELISGERRLRAARIAGLRVVPCVEISVNEKTSAVLALLENIQRQDLNFFEEADAINKMIKDFGISREEASKKLGKSPSALSNKLRLLKISAPEREKILDNNLTERHARALLRIPDEDVRLSTIDYIIEKNLNVSQTELFIDNLISPDKKKPKIVKICDTRLFINTITKAVDSIRKSGVNAITETKEGPEYTLYTIKIPHNNDKGIA
jgi:ParB family chromosome partitioning protein